MRLSALVLAACLGFVFATAVRAEQQPEETQVKTKTVVSVVEKRPPKHKTFTRKFTPPGRDASIAEVKWIMSLEQKRWGGPSLWHRIDCESDFIASKTNGQYKGVLQFGPVWDTMWPGTPLDVRYVKRKRPLKFATKTITYSDGTTLTKRKRVRVSRTFVYEGKLPRKGMSYGEGGPYHAWAAIRVGQRAVAGRGPTTSWECGL